MEMAVLSLSCIPPVTSSPLLPLSVHSVEDDEEGGGEEEEEEGGGGISISPLSVTWMWGRRREPGREGSIL